MTKVVVKKNGSKASGKSPRSAEVLQTKGVIGPDGRERVIHSADANSPSFGRDLERIFRLNVARARRENKRIVGTADFTPRW